MPNQTKQARIVVCDRKLAPNLPMVIVEIDDNLYIDIDTAARDVKSFMSTDTPNWFTNLKLVRWFWHYNQLGVEKYYCPAMETVLVDWTMSHITNLRLGHRAAWETTAEEVFTNCLGSQARFPVHFGTYDVALSAYFTSRLFSLEGAEAEQWKEECRQKSLADEFTMDNILAKQLATTEVYEANGEVNDWDYRLYGLWNFLTQPLRSVLHPC